MLRWLTALMAVVGLTAAAPPHQQPTPVPQPRRLDPRIWVAVTAPRPKLPGRRTSGEQAARDREWDAKWKKLNSEGVCKGC